MLADATGHCWPLTFFSDPMTRRNAPKSLKIAKNNGGARSAIAAASGSCQ